MYVCMCMYVCVCMYVCTYIKLINAQCEKLQIGSEGTPKPHFLSTLNPIPCTHPSEATTSPALCRAGKDYMDE